MDSARFIHSLMSLFIVLFLAHYFLSDLGMKILSSVMGDWWGVSTDCKLPARGKLDRKEIQVMLQIHSESHRSERMTLAVESGHPKEAHNLWNPFFTIWFDHHLLRHTSGTAMMLANLQQKSIQHMLRHKSIQTTDKYTHMAAMFLKSEGQKLSSLISLSEIND